MDSETPSSVYGPVTSWRLGKSLGIDLLCVDSICSFECVYCQLGTINRVTTERDVFVTTDRVMSDLESSGWQNADVVTLSGSGEPTLAKNLGEVIQKIKEYTRKPVIVLTNSTLLNSDEVLTEIALADRVFCKLDVWSDETLRRIDRPAKGISLESIVNGIVRLRGVFKGFLAIQTMILRMPDDSEIEALGKLLKRINPDEVQLNLPGRPIPKEYFIETRGNEVVDDPRFTHLRTISKGQLETIRVRLAAFTGVPVVAR